MESNLIGRNPLDKVSNINGAEVFCDLPSQRTNHGNQTSTI